jgi:gliding motility-associated-like protein
LNFTVNVFPYTTVSTSSELSAVCEGFPLWISAQSVVQAGSYFWTSTPPDLTLAGQESLQTPTVAPLVPTTYSCLITDINGCSGEADVFVDIREPIQGFISANPDLICTGETATIEFTGNTQPGISTFSWTFEGGNPSSSTLQNQNVVWNTAGTYNILLHIDEPGCEADFSFPVTIEPLPEPMMTASNNKGCQPLTVSFQDQSQNLLNPSYLWDFGDGNTSTLTNPEHLYPNPGTYQITLTVLNSTGCEQTMTFPGAVEVYPLPDAIFEAEPPAATLDNPKIWFKPGTSGPGNNHTWDFGDGSSPSNEPDPIHTYTAVGTYTILHTIENQYGCLDTDTLEVGITKDLKIFVPNSFTPNGDGLNDCFAVSGTVSDVVERFTVKIYNKWGQAIFEDVIKSYDCIWDGTGYNGKPLEGGEYVYVISGKDLQNKKHVYQGVLFLIR